MNYKIFNLNSEKEVFRNAINQWFPNFIDTWPTLKISVTHLICIESFTIIYLMERTNFIQSKHMKAVLGNP